MANGDAAMWYILQQTVRDGPYDSIVPIVDDYENDGAATRIEAAYQAGLPGVQWRSRNPPGCPFVVACTIIVDFDRPDEEFMHWKDVDKYGHSTEYDIARHPGGPPNKWCNYSIHDIPGTRARTLPPDSSSSVDAVATASFMRSLFQMSGASDDTSTSDLRRRLESVLAPGMLISCSHVVTEVTNGQTIGTVSDRADDDSA